MTLPTSSDDSFTEILNGWVINNDLKSANHLRSIIYYHLKGIVKKQITYKASSNKVIDQLPNTTSLLHEVLIKLSPPKEIFDNREQFFLSLATFIRWMLLDDLKAKNAQKRSSKIEDITEFFPLSDDLEPYFIFNNALSKLEELAPRSYQVALLHYFLGYDVDEIGIELTRKKSTVYSELSTAKAYLRTQY